MQHPKVVVIGAGSLFFGRQAIWQMIHSEHLQRGTLALVDPDASRLKKLQTLAQMVIDHAGVPLALEARTDHRDVLDGADFVVLSFAQDTVRYRGIDCAVSARHGVRMCSGDTIGPGGVFRTLRELPNILRVARDIEARCPDAWVINYINPSATHGIALQRFAPRLKSFALCDGLHMPHVKQNYAVRAGIIERKEDYTPDIDAAFEFRIAGPNHFTWLLRAEYRGEDRTPMIAESLRRDAARETDGGDTGAKTRFNSAISHSLYELFGHVPTCVAHTKEYVRFWQGLGRQPEPIPPLSLWETDERYQRHADMWAQIDRFVRGATPIGAYMSSFGPDHATDTIESMWAGLGKPFFINTPNRGAVPNMPDDAFLELLCDVDMDGPRPRPVGPMPLGLRGLMQQVLDTHELTAEAAAACDRDLLRRALATDPLISSIADMDAIIAELLDAERDALPEAWAATAAISTA